jgi:multidrug efflux system membrane fusion protein
MKRFIVAILFLALLAGGGFAYLQLHAAAQPKEPTQATAAPAPAVPVVAAVVVRKQVPIVINAIGTVQPIATVVVKSRVDGQIIKVNVQDGQEVKKGDVLFVLDSRAPEAQVRQADAQLAHDRISLANAKRESDRQEALVGKGYTPASTFDTVHTTAVALEATVRADEAALDNLKALLSYYTITSSINGRVGAIALKEGNNIKAVDTITLLTVNQMQPIYVAFSVPQRELLGIRNEMATHDLQVTAVAPTHTVAEKGKLAFIDNQVDATTGTVMLRAVFDNPKERLWPGLYVNVGLTLRVEPNALVIPAQAVQVGQEASYVYVIKPDRTVEPRNLKLGRSGNGETVVLDGLQEGEQVVVDGQLRLTKGSLVEPRAANGQAAAGASS